jgi:hypothetical protein
LKPISKKEAEAIFEDLEDKQMSKNKAFLRVVEA